eukprot:1168522-Prorocentrum_minimum.AAC.1
MAGETYRRCRSAPSRVTRSQSSGELREYSGYALAAREPIQRGAKGIFRARSSSEPQSSREAKGIFREYSPLSTARVKRGSRGDLSVKSRRP